MIRCPGQDPQRWKPEDIADVPCPHCGVLVEIWKDEPLRTCPACKGNVPNPRLDMGCAAWCASAKECLAGMQPPKKT